MNDPDTDQVIGDLVRIMCIKSGAITDTHRNVAEIAVREAIAMLGKEQGLQMITELIEDER